MRSPTEERIKIAVQKSGRLTEHSMELLVRCGLSYSRGKDQLICYGENMPVDVLLVRDDDIPRLVQEDICELGIVGLNVVEERRLEMLQQCPTAVLFSEVSKLDFGQCRLSFGVPDGVGYDGPKSLQGKRIATTYPRILAAYLARHQVTAQIVAFSGAVELAPSLGKADLICDLVSSGSTLRAHQLYEAETILESRAALIQTPVAIAQSKAKWLQRLLQRIQGVLQVKESKYIMLHAPRSALKAITALLPGSEAPTIMPLEGRDDKVAVHAVCRENVFWETLEQLKEAGASSMLVLPVEKMLS
ncbi:MAG TPA: ATP phosphoribosyltransferase [Gammaproteobacteria bacterium]|nr:ATP phosphoribosyltransferase [Gammaproteobacteria bacterium]